MEELQMAKRILIRKDTSTNWTNNNPVLYPGEFGVETDTLKIKMGPLVESPAVGTAWNSITTYLNVVPSDFNTIINGYLQATDLNDTVAALDGSQNLLIPNDSVIFEGATADSYELTLQATDPTADRTIIIPDIDGTLITDADTGTVTNTMLAGSISNDKLAGSIANNKLANSSVTINGYEISLGGSASYGTDNIGEGTTNLYFTNERAQDAAASMITNGTHTNISVQYNDSSNTLDLTGAVTYTDENARDAVAGLITGSTHDGISTSYTDDGSNAGTLVFTNTDKGSSQNIFKNVVVGATTVVADSNNDTLTIVGSNGVGAIANATNDVIEIYNTGVTSIAGTTNQIDVDNSTGSVTLSLPNAVTFPGTVTLHADPEQALQAATKQYVDGIAAGLTWKQAINLLATSNVALTGNTNTVTIDGHETLTSSHDGYRILLKNQTTDSEEGLYVYNDNGTTYTLSRSSDADAYGELEGASVFVMEGNTYGNTSWTQTNHYLSSFAGQTWSQFSGAGTFVSGNGLALDGNAFEIDTDVTVDVSTAQTLTNKTLTNPNINEAVALSATATELNILDGATLSTAELNTLDGITANTSELNILDGATLDVNELNILDGLTASTSELNTLDGITASTAELNILDGVTVTALEINTLAGITASTSELNILDGVTADYTELNVLDGITASTAELNILDGVTASAAELNILDGATLSVTELNYVDGVTSAIQTQLDGKVDESIITAKGDLYVGSASATLDNLAVGTDGYLLTADSNETLGVKWAAAPVSLPSQTGNSGKYLTTDGSSASWASLVVPIETGTATLSANTATTINTTALSAFTSIEYMVSLKQGSKVRTSKVLVQTDGTSVDMTEFAITETGGTMSGVVVSATTASTNAVLQVTVTDATSTNVSVKFSKVAL